MPAIFLHNGLTDLALGLGMTEVFHFWNDLIRSKYGAEPGFGTLNLPGLAAALDRAGLRDPLIMAPFNVAGFHMNPSQAACESSAASGAFTLLAMNVLVSGAAAPEAAFEYLARHPRVRNAVIGASTEEHLAQNAGLLKKHLGV